MVHPAPPGIARTTTTGLLALVVVTAALLVGLGYSLGPAAPPFAVPGPVPLGTPSGWGAVARASASLATGAGPASGDRLSCSALGPASARCASLSLDAVLATSNVGTWANLTANLGASPSARLALMTWDASDGYVLLYGGATIVGTLGDTWTYANGTWTNITGTLSGTPPRLSIGGIAYDPTSQKVIYFGGQNGTGRFQAQTWAYHAKSWTNLTGTVGAAPSARGLFGMVTDTTDGELLLFGGEVAAGAFLSDTWTFKNGAWTNITSTAPVSGVLALPAMADDPADHGVLLTGIEIWKATTPFVYRTATFEFAGGIWRNLTAGLALSPPLPYIASAAYSPVAQAVVLLVPLTLNASGGAVFASSTWEWSAGAWRNITVASGFPPAIGIAAGSAVEPTDGAILFFGGETSTSAFSHFTWVLSLPPDVTAAGPHPATVDAGTPVALSGAVSGGFGPFSVRWTFSDGAPNATGLSATHVFSATGYQTATLWATDSLGRTGSAAVGLFVNPALAVSASATPRAPAAGEGVAFVASVDGGTPPFTYAWSLGDGATDANASLAHTYAGAGTFSVALKVTDSLGRNASASLTVTVAAAPSTSVSLTSGTGLGLVIGIILLAVVAVVLGGLLLRRPRAPSGPPTPFGASSPPAGPGPTPPGPPPPSG